MALPRWIVGITGIMAGTFGASGRAEATELSHQDMAGTERLEACNPAAVSSHLIEQETRLQEERLANEVGIAVAIKNISLGEAVEHAVWLRESLQLYLLSDNDAITTALQVYNDIDMERAEKERYEQERQQEKVKDRPREAPKERGETSSVDSAGEWTQSIAQSREASPEKGNTIS